MDIVLRRIDVEEFQVHENMDYKSIRERIHCVSDYARSINLKETVVVMFANWKEYELLPNREEQMSIFVGHDFNDLLNFSENALKLENCGDYDFVIFQFENYKEAFSYCIDLKEGF